MFEHITINRQSLSGAPIDLGSFAECLLFYDKVRVVSDVDTFKYLVRCCGPEELLHLFSMGVLEIDFFENMVGVATVQTNHGELYDLKTLQAENLRYQRVSRMFFDEWAGPSGKGADKLFRKFDKLVERSGSSLDMLKHAHADLLDKAYLHESVRNVVPMIAPEYSLPEPLKFEIHSAEPPGPFFVDTNIDFDQANLSFQNHVPQGFGNLTVGYLLLQIVETRRDLIVGSRFNSDFSLGPVKAVAASCKFAELLRTANSGLSAADIFLEEVVEGVPRIRDVVNSGHRNFAEVIRLVEQAQKFKTWIKTQDNSEQLRTAYIRDVAHLDWADKLPPKSTRMLLMSSAGIALGTLLTNPLVGAAGAIALNAADYFLIDKLVKGWKPNQFIEGPLKEFLLKAHS